MTSYAASQILMEIILESGMPIEEFERRTYIKKTEVGDPDVQISMGSLLKLWQLAIDITGDPALALRLRKKVGLRSVHFIVTLAKHSSTLLEALFHYYRYGNLISTAEQRRFFEADGYYKAVHTNLYPEYQNRWLPEHNFSLALQLGKSILKKNFVPVSVHFQHTDPGYSQAYEEAFQAPVFFEQSKNMIIVRESDLLQPLKTHDPYLHNILKNYAEHSMSNLSNAKSLLHRIQKHIITYLPEGGIDVNKISEIMNMDRTTLYRQLKMEGTTFKELLLKIRKKLSKNYLEQGMTNTQVTYLLGFSEPSAFQHAFKNWFGMTPGSYRNTAMDPRSNNFTEYK